MISGILYAVGGFIEALIGIRFILRLVGANPNSGFVEWIYAWSSPFVAPFAGIFGQESSVTVPDAGVVTQSVFDWTALIALLVYAIAVGLITQALHRR